MSTIKTTTTTMTPEGADAIKFGKPSTTAKAIATVTYSTAAGERTVEVECFLGIKLGERMDTLEFEEFINKDLTPKILEETMLPTDLDVKTFTFNRGATHG